jgi:hypothetical protein
VDILFFRPSMHDLGGVRGLKKHCQTILDYGFDLDTASHTSLAGKKC